MHSQKLKQLESRLLEPISIPVIGRCLQKKAVTALAEDNSPNAVMVLAKAVTCVEDKEIKEIVLDALSKIRDPQCIDVFCQVWADTRHRDLTNLLVKKGWVASTPVNVRVLSALKAKQLKVITNGGKEVIESLLNAFQDRDSEISNRASECAIMFDRSEHQDLLCQLMIEQDHSIAHQVVTKAQYAPRKPSQRALFYFLTEQWDKYESLDFEHSLLQAAFEHNNKKLRHKIIEQIRKVGRVELLKVFVGENQNKRLEKMTDAEWDTTLAILDSGKQWTKMWQLAQDAPAIRSSQLLQKLKKVAWIPKVEEERKGFERLKHLASKCWNKISLMGELTHCQATLCDIFTSRFRFSPNGKILAIYYYNPERLKSSYINIRLRQMPSGQPLTTLVYPHDNIHHVSSIIFSPDSEIMATSSGPTPTSANVNNPNKIKLWQMPDGKLLNTLTGHTKRSWCLSFSPDGQVLASCGDNETILWQMPDGKLLNTLTGHRVLKNQFSPDGKLCASVSDGNIKLLQMPDGKLLNTLKCPSSPFISFSPNGQILAGICEGQIILWQMPEGSIVATFPAAHTDYNRRIKFSPDGQLLASNSNDKIMLWKMPEGKLVATINNKHFQLDSDWFSPDSKILVNTDGGKIELWSLDLPRLIEKPIRQLCPQDRKFIEKTLQDDKITKEERHWLEFMRALMDWHQRFDVEVEDAPQLVGTGEFDIEIEG